MDTIIPDYEPISLRGSGAFGYVIEAYDRIHDARVAIKRTHKVGTKLSREYEILSQIKDCEYIVKLMDTFYSVNDDGKVIQNLVFEYVTRSLESYMEEFRKKKEYIPINKIKQISKQLLLGLDYCHKKNIVHRDLKPENVLFTQDEVVKICDFGSSKCIKENNTSTPYIVSRYYRAPELILGKTDYNSKIDIFAAGCIIAELFTLTPLFPGKTEGLQIFEHMCILGSPGKEYFSQFKLPKNYMDYLDKIKCDGIESFDKLLNEDSAYSEEDVKNAADLILNMLNWNINKRYSAEQCLNHPFIKEIQKENKSQ
jgi:glycogen synthase kinase 3 beta